VVDNLRELLADLRAFTARRPVVELLVAFALAYAIVGVANAVVSGLVLSPITEPVHSFGGVGGELDFVIGGRLFQTEGILGSILVLALIAIAAGVLIRVWGDVLWQRDGELAECPYCLSDVPARAQVCAQCTRDLPAASQPA
jgi:large-conductance mechanosensitive channel